MVKLSMYHRYIGSTKRLGKSLQCFELHKYCKITLTGIQAVKSQQKDPLGEMSDYCVKDLCKAMVIIHCRRGIYSTASWSFSYCLCLLYIYPSTVHAL